MPSHIPAFLDTHEIVKLNLAIYAKELLKILRSLNENARPLDKKYVSQFLKSVCSNAGDKEKRSTLERDEEP